MAPMVSPSTVSGQNWWSKLENWMKASRDAIGGAAQAPPNTFIFDSGHEVLIGD